MKYAICDLCGQEMKPGTSCTFAHVKLGEEIVERDTTNFNSPDNCPDCNAPTGGYHHLGCDNERCPRCGGQLISCQYYFGEFLP